ncbi:hypothetical protein GO984_01765 [Rhodobacteraceae bacterium CY05]|uniref:Dystroglycan-type cadherin-like domain-containing protein n=1 Tax=Parasedimentitalea huanghaiensis TaxID=2682100 RepID=A0A6L6WA20_9RHOB|nr:hypothetical protein [Zongyanglinia huanghaiensis]
MTYDPTSSSVLDEMAQGETLEDSFTYTVSDGNGGFDTATVTLTVSGVDDPPILTGTTTAQSGFTDQDFTYQFAENLFTDHDEGEAITYDVTLSDGSPLPSFLSFDAGTRTVSFAANAPQIGDIGLYTLLVTASEPDGQSSTTTFTLSVLDGALIQGTSGNDNLTGTIQGDLIQGLAGNDTLYGLTGSDVLDGGADNDRLYGAAGDDVLLGGDGNDYLYGEDGNDSLYGGAGNDQLQQGNDGGTLDGGEGNDTMYASTDSSGNFTEILNGGNGNDYAYSVGYYSTDIVDMGAGDDYVQIYANGYSARPGQSTITLGAGADTVEITRYSNFNQYTTATFTDFNVGEDRIVFDDFLSQRLSGWDGASNPFGAGYLRIIQDGTSAVVQIDTNGGGDSFQSMFIFENTLIDDLSDQNFLIDAATSQGYDPDGGGVFGAVQNGDGFANALTGSFGDDDISGFAGNDTLDGGNGVDVLDGGEDDDLIIGGFGDDVMSGGAGADTFVFSSGEGADIIQDFVVGTDFLSLTGAQSIGSITEVDTDGIGGDDATLITFSDSSSVLLETVLGIIDPNDLLL